MQRFFYTFLFLFLSLFHTDLFGVDVKFSHPFKTGFTTRAVVQDHDGFLWIATSGGLARYDGYSLKFIKKGPGRLSGIGVNAVMVDRGGGLWVGTDDGGLNRFIREKGSFEVFRHDRENSHSLVSDNVTALLEASDGTIWVGTGAGLSGFSPEKGSFRNYPDFSGKIPGISRITALAEDPSGNIWVGTSRRGLFRLDPAAGSFTSYVHDQGRHRSISGNHVTSLCVDGQGGVWVATGAHGLNRFEENTGDFSRFRHDPKNSSSLSGDAIMTVAMDREGGIWVGTFDAGLNLFDPDTGGFKRFIHDPENPESIHGAAVSAVYEDSSGIVWVACLDGVIGKYRKNLKGFALYRNRHGDSGSISSDIVVPVYVDREETVWVGTGTGGLNRFNRDRENFTRYPHIPGDETTPAHSYVTAMTEDSDGNFWIATSNYSESVLSVFDRNSGKCSRHIRHDPEDPKSLPKGEVIRHIVQDMEEDDLLWLAVEGAGLVRFDRKKAGFTAFMHDKAFPGSIGSDMAKWLLQDPGGDLWVATAGGGLNLFNRDSGAFRRFLPETGVPDSILSRVVTSVMRDRHGVIWVGTDSGFGRLVDRKRGIFENYTTESGLPDSFVAGIVEDREGFLWMGTGGGLVRFRSDNGSFDTYTEKDGLQGNAFFHGAYAVTGEGELWFGGFGGVNRFHPEKIGPNPIRPEVRVVSLTRDGEPLLPKGGIFKTGHIYLPWKRNSFEFECVALEFSRPEFNRYRFFLEGHDRDWFESGMTRFGRYTGLSHGDYRLRILGGNEDGVWGEDEAVIEITVFPPLWKTWWFGLILVLMGVLLIFSVCYHFVKLNWEIMERQRAEAESRLLLEKYLILFESASDAILIMEKGIFAECNKMALELFGCVEKGEILGKSPLDFSPEFQPDGTFSADKIREYVSSATRGLPRRFYWQHLKKNGDPVDMEISVNGLVAEDREYLLAVGRDITQRLASERERARYSSDLEVLVEERTQSLREVNRELSREIDERADAETRLRQSQAQNRAILDGISMPMAFLNREKDVIWANRAALDGEDSSLWGNEGEKCFSGRAGRHCQCESCPVTRAFETGKSQSQVVPLDAGAFMEVKAEPVVDDDGAVLGVLMIAADMTEQKIMEEKIAIAEKMVSLSTLAAGLAHELNNPVAGVLQNLQVMASRLLKTSRRNLKVAEKCGVSMEQIMNFTRSQGIGNMFDHAVESGLRASAIVKQVTEISEKGEVVFSMVDINLLLEKVLHKVLREFELAGSSFLGALSLKRDLGNDISRVWCDEIRMGSALGHLIRNAFQAVAYAEKPCVGVSSRKDGGMVTIEVRDNGPGMDETLRKRAFDPFFSTRGSSFTGLGLSISYFIITEIHDGVMNVDSVPGRGSVVRISLETREHMEV